MNNMIEELTPFEQVKIYVELCVKNWEGREEFLSDYARGYYSANSAILAHILQVEQQSKEDECKE